MNNRYCVLLIGDIQNEAFWLQHLLQQSNYAVCIARDGATGWEIAYDMHPDLILLDMDAPFMNGFHILSLLKRSPTTAPIPVVIITTHETRHELDRSILLGAAGYLFKDDSLPMHDATHRVVTSLDDFLTLDAPGAEQQLTTSLFTLNHSTILQV